MRIGARDAELRAYQETVESFARWRSMLSQSAIADVYVRGLADYRGLSSAERHQFRAVMDEFAYAFMAMHARIEFGVYNGMDWDAQLRAFCRVLEQPGASAWWVEQSPVLGRAFVEEVEQRRAAIRADEPAGAPRPFESPT